MLLVINLRSFTSRLTLVFNLRVKVCDLLLENCSSKCDKDFVQKNGSGTALTQNLMKGKKKRSVGVIEKMAIAEIHVATGKAIQYSWSRSIYHCIYHFHCGFFF